MKHLVSLASLLWVAANLLLGFAALLPIAIIGWLIPLPTVSALSNFLVGKIYRFAVKMDSFWMQKVVGIELVVQGEANTSESPVVICNHQSWFDIPILQEIISARGPIITFLIKREIVWVPIIGWICLALNFPRLRRNKQAGARESDLSIIQKTTQGHDAGSGALLVFPEGSRFTEQKRIDRKSAYKNLLNPKAGGLRVIKQHVSADTQLIDITINYHQKNVRIWNCLHGDPARITITLEYFEMSDLADVEAWLNERWRAKDKVLGG